MSKVFGEREHKYLQLLLSEEHYKLRDELEDIKSKDNFSDEQKEILLHVMGKNYFKDEPRKKAISREMDLIERIKLKVMAVSRGR